MICYASYTNTRRNLAALRRHGWGLMLSPYNTHCMLESLRIGCHGFRICGDNGAWSAFNAGRPFDEDAYERFLEWIEPFSPDWLVLPDIVAGGMASLDLSMRYLNFCRASASVVLIAVQDGMTPDDLAPLVGPSVGIFLGGSTEWKLAHMPEWGAFCAERGIHYHVARVNTLKRMYLAIAAGADSIDGSSISRYAVTAPKLTYASQHCDLFSPRGRQLFRAS
jgi:hypothetical protein